MSSQKRPDIDPERASGVLGVLRPSTGNPDTLAGVRAMLRIFYATDVHGSEVCWRKFLNAGPFHKADVLILGGDLNGKATVPIVRNGELWEPLLQAHHFALETEDEGQAMEERIINRR